MRHVFCILVSSLRLLADNLADGSYRQSEASQVAHQRILGFLSNDLSIDKGAFIRRVLVEHVLHVLGRDPTSYA